MKRSGVGLCGVSFRSGRPGAGLATTASTPDTPGKWWPRSREQGHDVLLYENIEGGPGAAADNKQAALMDALAFSFLWNELKK